MNESQEQEKKQPFRLTMRNLMAQFNIRNTEIADSLSVSSQYISKFLNGMTLPNPRQMNRILVFLEERGIPEDRRQELIRVYIEEKTGLEVPVPDMKWNVSDPWEKKFLQDFRLLSLDGRKDVLMHMARLLVESL